MLKYVHMLLFSCHQLVKPLLLIVIQRLSGLLPRLQLSESLDSSLRIAFARASSLHLSCATARAWSSSLLPQPRAC